MRWDEEYDVFSKNGTHEYHNILQYSSFLVNNAMNQYKSPAMVARLSLEDPVDWDLLPLASAATVSSLPQPFGFALYLAQDKFRTGPGRGK
jgi:hypothetical protein